MLRADELLERWRAVRERGTPPHDATDAVLAPGAPGVLPEDRSEYLNLERRIAGYLAAARACAYSVHGEFIAPNAFRWSEGA